MVSKYSIQEKSKSPLSKILEFEILKTHFQNLIFQYSVYINGEPGYGKTEHRETSKIVDIISFSEHLSAIINNLKTREELAFHSVIIRNNTRYHLPLIDFAKPNIEDVFESICKLQENGNYNYDFYLFKSGRSYHAYIDTLLTDYQWKKFLGHLLLLNNEKKNITDTRWIGHSMIQGFSSLRLSCNTPLYRSYPTYWRKIPKRRSS